MEKNYKRGFKYTCYFNKAFILSFLKYRNNGFRRRKRVIPELKSISKDGNNIRDIYMMKVVRREPSK